IDQDDILLAPWRTIKSKVAGTSATTANQSSAATTTTATAGAAPQQVFTSSLRYPTGQLPTYPTQTASQSVDTPPPLLPTNVDQILVKVASEDEIKPAMAEITAVLRERHHLRPGQDNDFNLRDMTEISKAMGRSSQLMSGLLLIVAL